MAPGAPFIMPDGGRLQDVLATERRRAARGKGSSNGSGKQQQAELVHLLLQAAQQAGGGGSTLRSDQELAELRALEAVGARRRRRWLNEKHLRDLAGPLTAADMNSLFTPVPFGVVRDSPLTQIREDPDAAAVWDSFRNIDPEKEARVLQKWEEYNIEQARARRRGGAADADADGASTPESRIGGGGGRSRGQDSARAALEAWARVSRSSRAALRKANVHSVLALETQVLEQLEASSGSGRATLSLDDAFGRLLVHGLAQTVHKTPRLGACWCTAWHSEKPFGSVSSVPAPFHGLASVSEKPSGSVSFHGLASVSEKPSGAVSFHGLASVSEKPSSAVSVCRRPCALASGVAFTPPDITCTDVLLALGECGVGGLTRDGLGDYVRRHVHGVGSDTGSEAEWVVVA
ncbi:hypothetical protein FOA52_009503 [Chlamydomonas sp. UWO 241]|nr:hypothetical protein FOA52_009503 [Chlamydomonas sp. UWO 241]